MSNGDGESEESIWTPGVLAALIVVGFIALVGLWVVFGSSNGSETATSPPSTSPTSTDGTDRTDDSGGEVEVPVTAPNGERLTPGDGGCPPMPWNDEIPTTAPPATWVSINTVLVPTSTEHGPALFEGTHGEMARCFSRTPTGALIAMQQIEIRALVGRDGVEVSLTQVEPGAGRDIFVAHLEDRGWGDVTPGTLCQAAGFRITHYSDDEVIADLASRCPSGRLHQSQGRVVWRDGDWRRVIEPDGGFAPFQAGLADLRGFTVWGGI